MINNDILGKAIKVNRISYTIQHILYRLHKMYIIVKGSVYEKFDLIFSHI